jgi:hypothetical protein
MRLDDLVYMAVNEASRVLFCFRWASRLVKDQDAGQLPSELATARQACLPSSASRLVAAQGDRTPPCIGLIPEEARWSLGACELADDIQQHPDPRLQLRRGGVLTRVVADATDTGYEDHRGATDTGHHLRVVPGARGHPPRSQAEPGRRLHGFNKGRVDGHRSEAGQALDGDRGPSESASSSR